ncbi:hypothetical protein AJ80_08648 [Polytolypa hystricis UAMH7299]|uniref:Uncharacterized protein n=1 Tax=Polytolypa hystricis (strain UAMH7299) TaxID=1447883 RepID=A0A2B7X530_POLH7|nr:hypothetical protein AJ80_08648 [Polytolypa hystricis UAMH7299]
MSLQTTQLVNGVWTSRRVGIDELLARNRESSSKQPNLAKHKLPLNGLLSRTVVQCPMIQWVLPARLRHSLHNDVIFVGETFIQIKELMEEGHLEDVTTKCDFDSKIVSATVVGRRYEMTLETQIQHGARGGTSSGPELEDWLPQVLVLVLASKEVIFLGRTEDPHGTSAFVHAQCPLPADVSSLEQYGRHIAIDPRSRAMAISAASEFFGIFSLKPLSAIHSGLREGATSPIQEERFFRVGGDIIAMEFLYPPAEDDDRAILLLIVSKCAGVFLSCYEWKTSEGLRSVRLKVSDEKLPSDAQIPSLVMPLRRDTAFMLVYPGFALRYNNIMHGNATVRSPFLDKESPTGTNTLEWTAWARPWRNHNRKEIYDDIYLCREDGSVLYLEAKIEGQLDLVHSVGNLGCTVDTGFAILSGGRASGDLLVAAGSMSHGGLFSARPREPLELIQSFPNWAPLLDSVVVKNPRSFTGFNSGVEADLIQTQERIFVCSGTGRGEGLITELRYGLEGRIGLMIDQEIMVNILDVWSIPDVSAGGVFFLLSSPLQSFLISVPIDFGQDLYALDEESSGLDFSGQTLAAGCTADGVVIQVTGRSIRLSVMAHEQLRFSTHCQPPSEHIVRAAVNDKLALLAVAVNSGGSISVHLSRIEVNDIGLRLVPIGQPMPLPYEPVCCEIKQLSASCYLFIGTTEGKLLVSEVDMDHGLTPKLEQTISLTSGNDESRVCECLGIISSAKRGIQRYTLFCGLRSGNLVPFNVAVDDRANTIVLNQGPPWKIGDTSVKIKGLEYDKSFAVVGCGSGLWRLSHSKDEDSARYVLENIWITDHKNNPAFLQSKIDVFTCIDTYPFSTTGGLAGSLVCISESQLMICTVDKTPKTVPRHISLPGRARRIMYSDYLKRLVVAYNAVETEDGPEYTKRWTRPRIAFVDPDFRAPVSFSGGPTGGSGEMVTALLDWHFSDGEKDYNLIVVATKQPLTQASSTHQGRLIYIQARPSAHAQGQISSAVKYVYPYERPIRAISRFGPCSLVLAVGDQIKFQTLDPTTKKWSHFPGFTLESTPVSVSVKEPFIYAMTSGNSLVILKAGSDSLSLYGQEGTDREGLDHCMLPDPSQIILTSSRGGAIVGLSEATINMDEKLIKSVFTAHMPLSSINLHNSYRQVTSASSTATYGMTIDGTVYRFTTLNENEWRLLRFIQNICMQDRRICPFTRRKRTHVDDHNVSISKPESLHVNGDILSRITDHGIRSLHHLMGPDGEHNTTSSSSSSPSKPGDNAGGATADTMDVSDPRLGRFAELAVAVVGNDNDPFVAVMAWLENLVRISF